jgi:hypothetical protein
MRSVGVVVRIIAGGSFACLLSACSTSVKTAPQDSPQAGTPTPAPSSQESPGNLEAENAAAPADGGNGPTPRLKPHWNIVTWGPNTDEWNRKLRITHIELGCSVEPKVCVPLLTSTADLQQIPEWTLAMSVDPTNVAAWSLAYSQASLTERRMVSISFDDFFLNYTRWLDREDVDAPELLRTVLANTKAANPTLLFGITLYEDELGAPALATIPAEMRARIDRVTLYVRNRPDELHFESYLLLARSLFPNAEFWAGSYAYDRIDYWTCWSGRPCTANEQRSIFSSSIETQAQMLRDGRVSGIEFYPGSFGQEDTWHAWNLPHICKPERRGACIENTKEMHQIALETLERYRPPDP